MVSGLNSRKQIKIYKYVSVEAKGSLNIAAKYELKK